MRRVRSTWSVIEKERLLRRNRVHLMEPADGLISHIGRERITLFRRMRRFYGNGIAKESRIVLVVVSSKKAIEVLKAKTCRPAVEWSRRTYLPDRCVMPLSKCRSAVAVVLQHFGNGGCVLRPQAVVAGKTAGRFGNRTETDLMIVSPREQSSARRRAKRIDVKVVIAKTARGE